MERVNIPLSVQNLGNVDKVQNKLTHASAEAALVNSQLNNEKEVEKQQKPNEIDGAEGLIVDPDQEKEKDQNKKDKKKKRKIDPKTNNGKNSGKFIDYSV